MFEQALPQNTKKYLAILDEKKVLPPKTYLSGGTAIALQLGHRISFDLDFFCQDEFDINRVLNNLGKIKDFQLDRTDWGTILGRFTNCKFSLFYYQYPLLKKPLKFKGIEISSLEDLAASKINAISSRGTKRDFVDIYYILKMANIGDLTECLNLYQKRFKNLASQRAHILKSLIYFEDAERDNDPEILLDGYSWQKIKNFIELETKKYLQSEIR